VHPRIQSFLLADNVYQDHKSGKYVICGVFRGIKRFNPPQAKKVTDGNEKYANVVVRKDAGSPEIFLSITEIHGEQTLSLRLVRLSDSKSIVETSFSVKSSSPLHTRELSLPFPSLGIFEPGHYSIDLLCDEELIGSYRIAIEDEETRNE
jgi:hypothetical protein